MKQANARPFKELSLVIVSPFFAALFALPVVQCVDLVMRPWLYADLPAWLSLLALGLVVGISSSYLGIRWLLALLFKEKSTYNLSYHIVYLFLPTAAIAIYGIVYALSAFVSLIQSPAVLVMFAIAGFGLGLAGTTLGAMAFVYLRVGRRKQSIVWVYHRGRSRLSGSVELFRAPKAGQSSRDG
jgi:hypothetical protein